MIEFLGCLTLGHSGCFANNLEHENKTIKTPGKKTE